MKKSPTSQDMLTKPVETIFTEEEENLLKFMADVIIEKSFKEAYEKRNSLPQIQQHRAEQRQH